MILLFLLSWTVGKGSMRRGGSLNHPVWEDIVTHLEHIRIHSGTVTLDVVDGQESGPQSLQVRSDQGAFLLTLGELTNSDYDVRSYQSDYPRYDGVEILGDVWDGTMVCFDYDVVTRAFRDFFYNGDVSRDILQ